tara:strand:+ start:1180 stop:1593 length:414 start_codon:yes stop_codon:yes gene_type:complete
MESVPLVTREIAEKEVQAWLDHKGLRPRKRKELEDNIEELVQCVMWGDLVINSDTFDITQKLATPAGSDGKIKELVWMPKITVGGLNKYLTGVKSGDVDARLIAYSAALTKNNTGIIKLLDTGDNAICGTIVIFFIS